MSYVRLDDNFADHPKLRRYSRRARCSAGWLHVEALCYAGRHNTDGFIPSEVAGEFGSQADIARLTAPFNNGCGLWEVTDGGYLIHDYLDYNPSRREVDEKRDKARERMRRVRGVFADSSREQEVKFAKCSPNPQPLPHIEGLSLTGTRAVESTIAAQCTTCWGLKQVRVSVGEAEDGSDDAYGPCPECGAS